MTRALRMALVIGVGAGLGAASGCARTIGPEGGAVPETPPRVVSTNPPSFEVVEPFDGPVRIEFERTLAERLVAGALRDAVVVSPRAGEVEVRQRGSTLEIRMEEGFRAAAVYRITVLPVFQDRFRNTLDRPVDLFFSTGPPFDETLVAGFVSDLLTGTEVSGVRVDAVPVGEGPTYSAVSDDTGVFSFRYLPPGEYRITAWEDLNRNLEADFEERQAATQLNVNSADTLVITDLELLAPDTTAARVLSARMLDSLAVEITVDDPLDPRASLEGVQVVLALAEGAEEDERPEGLAPLSAAGLPQVEQVIHGHAWEAFRAARDAAAAARGADDPDDPPADPDDPPEPAAPPPAAAGDTEPDGSELLRPGSTVVVILDRPLPPAARLLLRVENLVNLAGIPEGGGEAEFLTPSPPPPAEAPSPPGVEPGAP